MDDAQPSAPGDLATWRTEPLVVAARVEGPDDAVLVRDRLELDHPGTRFLAVLAVADAGELAGTLDGLAPVLAERVFATLAPGSPPEGHHLATAALEVHGVGQDFVFEVPTVADAVRLGLRALSPDADVSWDGTALLVPGGAALLEQARAALADTPPAAT